MQQRTLPQKLKGKTDVGVYVHWFYNTFLGFPPDASMYAKHSSKKNPRALVHLFVAQDADVATYTLEEVGELAWYLHDNGVSLDDVFIVTIPGLMYNFKYRDKSESCARELSRSVEYLRGRQGSDFSKVTFNQLEGW